MHNEDSQTMRRGFFKTTAKARQYVTDFLRLVYAHTKETIEGEMGFSNRNGWRDLVVELVSSERLFDPAVQGIVNKMEAQLDWLKDRRRTEQVKHFVRHWLVLEHKRGTCFRAGYKFYICEFGIRVIAAPAELRFELWFGGTKFSSNHEPIKVVWQEGGTNS
ncbi:Hsp70 family chaperone [Apiospora kogelbergensis]|uniref:Hsp70 family chaperone n=1 Tax=Apiospora kogelbergensis TaxID=1337665 RepID=A0AAW0R534_9PEZI